MIDTDIANSTILIVDDNPTNLAVLSKALKTNGYTVAVATDGEEAIEQVEYSPPNLILLDVMMPGIDGFETCKQMKASNTACDIPIIFMTALADSADKVKGLSLGAVDYITKPFQQDEVLARVRVHLQLRHLSKTLKEQNEQLKAEIQQRKEAEATLQNTLEQLQAAQKQIIAQEKLASLGTLTAGVAHELRNPLNFINNYAIGSLELADEVLGELDNIGDCLADDDRDNLQEILNDIKDNSRSIHHHGQRSESIIQNMLMHSRTEGGQVQPADLNGLLSQAVELAYHSLRAKDSSFNITIDAQYDKSIGDIEVVPSDLSRAFINIIDNACYAVHQKKKQLGEGFSPTLSVRTKREENNVKISIRDNGPGIPEAVREKVFHPFFTTKPTGDGTGLGLSLTHDITVGKHRGTLTLETEMGSHSEFVILLPIS